jgi:hypothetical protein
MQSRVEGAGNGTGTKPRMPWWLPLLLPAAILALIAIDGYSKGTHVVQAPDFAGAIGAALTVAAVIGLPTFIAGLVYERRSN